MGIYEKIFGSISSRELKSLKPYISKINSLESEIQVLSDEELKAKTSYFKEKIKNAVSSSSKEDSTEQGDLSQRAFQAEQRVLEEILPEAFAVVREASKRILGMRHFDVQMIGGAVLHHGKIAEMRTGEGKTLVSTLAIYLNALTGKGVHVVTVNDYLAKRDGEWMGRIYDFLGLSVGIIVHDHSYRLDFSKKESNGEKPENESEAKVQIAVEQENLIEVERKDAYAADITYGTNNEFGFDYLRDNMAFSPEEKVQRPLYYAVIDEIDSILIDEARTPLIISAPAEESGDLYKKFSSIVPQLEKEADFTIDEKMKAVSLTDDGIKKLEGILGMENIYDKGVELVHHLEQALKAHVLFLKDRDYVLRDGEVVIVDEFTGRLMPGRRYSEGLHQAIEAKEGVEVKRESLTLATITFQNYFRIYKKLSGMTGTAMTESEEFFKIYKLDVVAIPTNREMIRKDLSDKIYKNEEQKFKALVKETKERYERGQPVLIGTISIEKNELLSNMLKINGIPHEVLNAKQHEREAAIISQAGAKGAVTVATNMAGRGVDIILGGHPYDKEKGEEVRALGGLCVFGTERHESRRIDNQLRGRAGRQGDPGFSQFFIGLDDDLMRVFGGDRIKNLMNALKIPDDQPIENKMINSSIEMAQKKVEGHNFDIRKHVLEYDDVMNKQRKAIYTKRDRILSGKDEDDGDEVGLIEKTRLVFADFVENMVDDAVSSNENWADAKAKIWVELTSLIEKERVNISQEDFDSFGNGEDLKKFILDAFNSVVNQMISNMGDDEATGILKYIYLRVIDMYWVQHLTEMEHLRAGIGLVGYGQKDPLVEYKHKSYTMFQQLLDIIDENFIRTLLRIRIEKKPDANQDQRSRGVETKKEEPSAIGENEEKGAPEEPASFVQKEKVGRNDLCPCGSGKKYKRCCGK